MTYNRRRSTGPWLRRCSQVAQTVASVARSAWWAFGGVAKTLGIVLLVAAGTMAAIGCEGLVEVMWR